MLFHMWEYPFENMVFSNFWEKIGTTNFHAIKNEF